MNCCVGKKKEEIEYFKLKLKKLDKLMDIKTYLDSQQKLDNLMMVLFNGVQRSSFNYMRRIALEDDTQDLKEIKQYFLNPQNVSKLDNGIRQLIRLDSTFK
jgi:hypothetical protein